MVAQFHWQVSSLSKSTLELALEVRALYRRRWPARQQAESLQNNGRM